MAGLKAIVEDINSVPEPARAFYAKSDAAGGRFVLGVDPVDGFALEDVKGLRSALESERKSVSDFKSKVSAFEGLDPAAARDALKKVEDMKTWKPDDKVREMIETRTKEVTDKFDKELKAAQDENGVLTKALHSALIDSAATAAITKSKGSPVLLLPHVRASTRVARRDDGTFVVEVLGNGGTTRVSPKTGSTAPMTIEELVEEMKSSKDFMQAFEGSGAQGSGASGGRSAGTGGVIEIDDDTARDARKFRAVQEEAKKTGAKIRLPDGTVLSS